MLNLNKTEKEEMTEKEAFSLIKEWADSLEVRLRGDDFEDLQNELWFAVKKERLIFDSGKEVFTYTLKKPIEFKDKSGSLSIIKILESDMNDKKDIAKHKDIDAVIEMFGAYCRDSEGEKIPSGFLSRIKDRDQAIISAVILGFFVQVVPSQK